MPLKFTRSASVIDINAVTGSLSAVLFACSLRVREGVWRADLGWSVRGVFDRLVATQGCRKLPISHYRTHICNLLLWGDICSPVVR